MQMGFNNDVPYKGATLHIQTEDHGLNAKKVTSHVFRGGAILDSKTVSYEDEIASFDDPQQRDERIRAFMKALHRHFYKRIHAGEYDELLDLDAPAETAPEASDVDPGESAAGLSSPEAHLVAEGFEIAGDHEELGELYDAHSRGEPLDDFEPLSSEAWLGDAATPSADDHDPVAYGDRRAWRGVDEDEDLGAFLREALGAS